MKQRSRDNGKNRGAAILLAMLVASIVPLASLALLRAASNARLAERFSEEDQIGRDIVKDLTPMLLTWAVEHAEVDWLSERTESDDRDAIGAEIVRMEDGPGGWSVRVRAIDLSGRLHARFIESAAAAGVPQMVFGRINPDQVSSHYQAQSPPSHAPVLLESLLFSSEAVYPVGDDPMWHASPSAWVTTHGPGALNVRTAPIELLEPALSGIESGMRQEVLELRRAAKPISDSLVRGVIALGQGESSDTASTTGEVPLSGESEAMGFIVELEDPSRRTLAWWIVAELTPEQDGSARSEPRTWSIVEWRRIPR